MLEPQKSTYLHTQLAPGETLLWAGGTDVTGRMKKLRPFLFGLIPFNALFCGLTLGASNVWNGIIFGLIWISVGVVVWLGQRAHLTQTLYAITNQQALILKLGSPKKTERYPPAKMTNLHLANTQDGRGDVLFTVREHRGRNGTRVRVPYGFLAVENPAQVRAMLLTLIQTAPSPSKPSLPSTALYSRDALN